jgi:hypothetical protein
MLALADDAALARLVIAATAIPRRARLSWLRDIASRAENPSAQLAATPRHAPAAATPCTSSASKLFDRAVECVEPRSACRRAAVRWFANSQSDANH